MLEKMSKIPTAEEFFKKYSDNTSLAEGHYDYLVEKDSFKEAMIEFAKLHVEEALKEASEKAKTDYEYLGESGEFEDIPVYEYFVDKDSILNAYPLENIK